MRSVADGRVSFRGLAVFIVAAAAMAPAGLARAGDPAADAAYEQRLFDLEKVLASDDFEGRGPGIAGIDLAADFIAKQFADVGLKTDVVENGPFQRFNVTVRLDQGEPNVARWIVPGEAGQPEKTVELGLGVDYTPMALGSSGKFQAPLAFVGYGITAPDKNYDDYAGIDVKGKAVVILRHEPQQDDPHSVFDGTNVSLLYAPFVRKISNAYEHGAAAVIFVTDAVDLAKRKPMLRTSLDGTLDELQKQQEDFAKIGEPTEEDVQKHLKEIARLVSSVRDQRAALALDDDILVGFQSGSQGEEGQRMPVMHCRRAAIDPLLKAVCGTDLATLEKQIDVGPTPQSRVLEGCRAEGEFTVNRVEATLKNVVGVLEGEGPLADETIVIGAHYDHLGRGGAGSLAPGSTEIHNGADDNASGTSALIEIARDLATRARAKKLPRRVVFLAFSGEEMGLLGSAYYCNRNPLFPLDKTVAMLNLDMVGRLTDNKLIVQGVDTATEFGGAIDRLNERFKFEIARQPGGFGPSDHSSFFAKKIPVMHFFTNLHPDYHRPSDDVDKLNLEGMRRVAQLTVEVAVAVAEAPARPTLADLPEQAAPTAGKGGSRPYFGSIPEFGRTEPGLAISGVAKNGPAAKAGLQAGDVIVKLGDSKIGNLDDFDSALRKHKGGDKVPVIVMRKDKELTFEVELGQPRG